MKTIKSSIILFLLPVFALLTACGGGTDKKTEDTTPPEPPKEENVVPSAETITFSVEGLYPEGVSYDPTRKGFIVTSLTKGQLGLVDNEGNYEVLVQDSALISAIGVKVDAPRNRILVCNSDPGVSVQTNPDKQGKFGQLLVYNLKTLKRVRLIELSEMLPEQGHFANDLIVDKDGNIYITDSFSPIIYKVDNTNTASVFFQDPTLAGEGFGLNGIVLHPDGYLLVAKYNDGTLYKIPTEDPKAYTQVTLSQAYPGADGLIWKDPSNLVLIANASNEPTNKAIHLQSSDGWTSATEMGTFDTGNVFPTTATTADGQLYILYAHLNVLFGGEPPVSEFTIQKLPF